MLESRSPRLRRFRDSSNGLWETLNFSTLSTNNELDQRKSWRVNFHDHHHCASRSHNETKLKRIWNNSNNSHTLGKGGRHVYGRRHGNVKGRCACHHLWKPRKAKKILFERLFSGNKKINTLTEVKQNRYLTASGIKFFQKQTAGNNCPVCMTDRLNV